MQELVDEGKISTHYVKIENQLADLGTKHLRKHRHHGHIKLINEFKAVRGPVDMDEQKKVETIFFIGGNKKNNRNSLFIHIEDIMVKETPLKRQ